MSLLAGVAVLIALAAPYATIETGSAGVGTLPESFQTRAAYDAIEKAFGPQGTATAEVVVEGERTPALQAAVAGLRTRSRTTRSTARRASTSRRVATSRESPSRSTPTPPAPRRSPRSRTSASATCRTRWPA